MAITLLVFFASAAAIYFACEYFVNGVEWLGRRLKLGATVTGTVLAAFGTALPESAITFASAVFGKTADQKDVGVGAALGGPLVLSTIAYAVIGVVLLAKKRGNDTVHGNGTRLARDQAWFLGIFALKVGVGLFAFPGKRWVGIAFFAAYAVYLVQELVGRDAGDDEDEELEPLRFRPKDPQPTLTWALIQSLFALGVIAVASHFFVHQIGDIGVAAGLEPHVIALLLSPVATELPETMNAIIWARQGRERLALANISGAMMIQATIPSGLGILFTPWLFDTTLVVAGACTALSILWLCISFRKGSVSPRALLPPLGCYALFAAYLAWTSITR